MLFDLLFGWRRASKCKKLIRQIQCRLKLLKNKRCCTVRQLREDVAQLLKDGCQDAAFKRAEQLIKAESIVAVYELLDHFCEFITLNFSYIRRHKDCPNDINEAISSLIFASTRCGDLPELGVVRNLFEERYGRRFASSAAGLYPGNLVNCQVKEKLSITSVSEDMKHRMVNEIARSNSIQQWPMACEYGPELQQQQQQQQQIKESEDMQEEIHVSKMSLTPGFWYFNQQFQQPIGTTDFPEKRRESREFSQQHSPILVRRHARIDAAALEQEKDRVDGKSSESPYQFAEEAVVYLDDIQELQSATEDDSSCQDQRIFMFSSALVPKREISEADEYDSWKTEKAARKRFRKRLIHQKNRNIKDIKYEDYYDNGSFNTCPDQGHGSHDQRKQGKKITENVRQRVGRNFMSGKCGDDQLIRSCNRGRPNCQFAALSVEQQPQKHCKKTEKPQAPSLKAITMPEERAQENCTANIQQSYSFPLEHPNQSIHVHPKLPDYDHLAAKFTAFKKAYLQTKQPTNQLEEAGH